MRPSRSVVIATEWRLKPIAPPLIIFSHAETKDELLRPKQIGPAQLEKCKDLGATMASGLAMASSEIVEPTPSRS
jgi:hypothetical protein